MTPLDFGCGDRQWKCELPAVAITVGPLRIEPCGELGWMGTAAYGAQLPVRRPPRSGNSYPIAAIEEQLGGRVIALKRSVGRLR